MSSHSLSRVALIGRPNVGKSTLFNRLVGRKLAIVHNQPGVTRDWREAESHFGDIPFLVIDTAGLEDQVHSEVEMAMDAQTKKAIERADILLFVVDARTGITPIDSELARIIRRKGKPTLVVANKAERAGRAGYAHTVEAEAGSLGLGEVLCVSAEHGEGIQELYEALMPFLNRSEEETGEEGEEGMTEEWEEDKTISSPEELATERPLRLAIVGRPNVGKSTLINQLIGEERLLVADQPGITRDSITLDWSYEGRSIQLVDTAGLRRARPGSVRALRGEDHLEETVESLSALATHQTIRFAEVVVLVMDAEQALEKQDLALADFVLKEGRGLVLALNKWDKIRNPSARLKEIENLLKHQLAQVQGIACIPVSAKRGWNLETLMEAIIEVNALWNRRLSTPQLNRWLAVQVEHHPPPPVAGRRPRLKYMTQLKIRPPTFAVFCTRAEELPDSYIKYLINGLRRDFQWPGVPLRIYLRSSKNPYVK